MKDSFYLSTAIAYVNGKPHVGHAYEFIASDAICRYQRMIGKKVFFLSGVDEHSAQVEKAAREEGLPTQEYCDKMAVVFTELHEKLGTKLDGFVRTSEPRHHDTTKELLRRSYEKGDIYQGHYEGWYCDACERYYQDDELDEGNECPTHKRPCQWLKEENYFFKLSNYTEAMKKHYEQCPTFTQPEGYKNEMLALLDQGLRDISISRSTTTWGIPLPWDESHVAYVWFDALSNYITGVGFLKDDELFNTFWPADIHVIGKDINRFHSVLWPAMLMSCDIPLPKQILIHGFIYHKGEKMSKTIGNIIDPLALIDAYGRDPLRYFLLSEVAFGQDGNYSEEALINRYNADLANDLGNLTSRVLSMVKKYRDKVVPDPTEFNDSLREDIAKTRQSYREHMDNNALHLGLGVIWDLISNANKYVDEQAPWTLAKDESKKNDLDRVLLNLVETLRATAVMIYPVMPDISTEMLNRLSCPIEGDFPLLSDLEQPNQCAGKTIEPGKSLFPRIEK